MQGHYSILERMLATLISGKQLQHPRFQNKLECRLKENIIIAALHFLK